MVLYTLQSKLLCGQHAWLFIKSKMSVSKEDLSKLRNEFANDLNTLQKKFENIVNVVKICNDNFNTIKQRVINIEEKAEQQSTNQVDTSKIDEEISKLREQKNENWEEMREIQGRIALLDKD